ncbi:LysR family transcriptional regulator [Glaciecola siphonariae]|uniref:LysR family transcriptional regulator n=1 Tax=Glaciecola siphonariae TaxID=521012 RepID=A0ABV9LS76_9ALTE
MSQSRKHLKQINWEDIRYLGAIYQYKSVRASARFLGVHHSTVSRRMDALEHSASSKLLHRTPEGFVLTEAGELLAQTANNIEDMVFRAQRLIAGGESALKGKITVSMPEPIATQVFAKHLAQFRQRYPKLEVCMSSTYEMVDLARQQADIVIRLSNSPDENLFGKRLFSYYSCAYVAKDAEKRLSQNNWQDCQWIAWSETSSIDTSWLRDSGLDRIKFWGKFPDLIMQTELAAKGLGLAFLPCFLGDTHPNLTRVNSAKPIKERDLWILTHTDLKKSKKVRAFMQFAEQILLQYKPQFEGDLTEAQTSN